MLKYSGSATLPTGETILDAKAARHLNRKAGGATYREPGQAGTLLLAALARPAHIGAGRALGGQRAGTAAQALGGAGRPGIPRVIGVALLLTGRPRSIRTLHHI